MRRHCAVHGEEWERKCVQCNSVLNSLAEMQREPTMPKKEYDGTLARIAGNIAAGIISTEQYHVQQETDQQAIASYAMNIAANIIELSRNEKHVEVNIKMQKE